MQKSQVTGLGTHTHTHTHTLTLTHTHLTYDHTLPNQTHWYCMNVHSNISVVITLKVINLVRFEMFFR